MTQSRAAEALEAFNDCVENSDGAIHETLLYHAETIRAALQQQHKWQDISTAPRDGTRIIVCCGEHPSIAYFEKAKDRRDIDMWLTNVWSEEIGRTRTMIKPQVWMPLPQPPDTGEKA